VEKIKKYFPYCGKTSKKFSIAWKTPRNIFHGVENILDASLIFSGAGRFYWGLFVGSGRFGRFVWKGAFELTGKGLGSMLGAQFALTSSTLDLQKTN